MRYEVIGADRTTGRDVTRVYDARDEDEATRRANADGVVVDSVDVLIDMRPTAVAARAAASVLRVPPAAIAQPAATIPRPVAAVEYRAPTTGDVPSYRGLIVAATVLRIYATVCYTIGAVLLVAALGTIGGAVANAGTAGLIMGASFLLPTLGLLFAGAVSHGLGAACVALRDIARNSWR